MAVSARRGYREKQYHYEMVTLAISAGGANTDAVTFDTAYTNAPPSVTVIAPLGVNGTWSAGSITTTGFSFSISGASDLASKNAEIVWFAHEPM